MLLSRCAGNLKHVDPHVVSNTMHICSSLTVAGTEADVSAVQVRSDCSEIELVWVELVLWLIWSPCQQDARAAIDWLQQLNKTEQH